MGKELERFSGFADDNKIAGGALADVAVAVKAASDIDPAQSYLVFDNLRATIVDLDLRGSEADIRAAHPPDVEEAPVKEASAVERLTAPRGRGRPKLGVVSREVTLLPQQWDWLRAQRGGASGTLRRLVSAARKASASDDDRRSARNRGYAFMTAFLGNSPGFEEASRALFAGDGAAFGAQIQTWPTDLRDHLRALCSGAFNEASASSAA